VLSPPHDQADADDAALVRAFRRVLTATVTSADLVTLELQVQGAPQLSLLTTTRGSGPVPELAVWPTLIAPGAWHDGLLLAAAAVTADAARRVAVHSAATLVADLLVAERRRRIAELAARRAADLAGVDALTGVGNRRAWHRGLEEEGSRAARYARSSAIVVVDLDDLKRINDEQGHAAGDAVLQRAAEAMRAASRTVDLVCRLGGDEFGVLAPETGPEGADRLASRLRAQLDSAGVQASVGVATSTDSDLERAWHLADREMYRYKRERRTAQAVGGGPSGP
jgi:diguanylate cyclase (GGDEF)-like protein